MAQYAAEADEHWERVLTISSKLKKTALADLIIEQALAFARVRPAYLPLFGAPYVFQRSVAARQPLRKSFAAALRRLNPSLSQDQSFISAHVVVGLIKAGRNWLFAMADLEMTARDVALWDISVINQTLLSPASYEAMSSDTKTAEGRSAGYDLGFFVRQIAETDGKQHLLLHHPGEISGFRSHNFILPELEAAVVILTNAECSDVTTRLADQIQGLVGIQPAEPISSTTRVSSTPPSSTPKEDAIEARAHKLLLGLAQGRIDREDLAPDATATFTPQAVSDIRQSLAPLGDLERVRVDSTQLRGGTKHYALTLIYSHRELQVAEYDLADGKIEQFLIDDKP